MMTWVWRGGGVASTRPGTPDSESCVPQYYIRTFYWKYIGVAIYPVAVHQASVIRTWHVDPASILCDYRHGMLSFWCCLTARSKTSHYICINQLLWKKTYNQPLPLRHYSKEMMLQGSHILFDFMSWDEMATLSFWSLYQHPLVCVRACVHACARVLCHIYIIWILTERNNIFSALLTG